MTVEKEISPPAGENEGERYKDLFERSPHPAAVFDAAGRCLLVNGAFLHQLGYPRDGLLGGSHLFRDLFSREQSAESLLAELQDRRVIRRREVVLRDVEGGAFPALLSARWIPSDETPSFEVNLVDIRRWQTLENALQEDHARMSSLIKSLSAGLFLVDQNNQVTTCNQALINLLVIEDMDALIGQGVEEIFRALITAAREPEMVQRALRRAAREVAQRPVIEIPIEDEGQTHLEITFFPVRGENGLPLGWGGLVQDITDVKDRARWKLELLSILAHDLRTPLATLKGHATALLANYKRWGDDLVTEFLTTIDESTDKLVRQVDRSLALTRVETGRLGLRPAAVHPLTLITQAVERAAGALDEAPVKSLAPSDLPQVRADPARVEEVLVNLLENAVHHTPPGTPIQIQVETRGSMVEISVTDHGPGIPRDQQGLIFERYYQGDGETTGTGLGLYISRKIVEAHGGRIQVKSPADEAGWGTRFAFTLPVMPESRERDTPKADRPSTPVKMAKGGVQVLVVEDEVDFQALLHTILSEAGYEVNIATDGPGALDLAQAIDPDIIILDWRLPGLDGLSVCRNIRRWSDVPILMVTSRTAQDDLIAGLDAGADDYLTKPFKGDELLARMRALLRRRKSWRSSEEKDHFHSHGLRIDFHARDAWLRGGRLDLTPTEYDILACLARHRGQVMTYGQLSECIWGPTSARGRASLFAHISRLRNKIETDPEDPHFIQTRWGVGYVFLPAGQS
jgi:PAS domain S-box-containing protein